MKQQVSIPTASSSSHSVPVSRRNSFSRNASATIDQFRSALNEARDGNNSLASPKSPRKTVSFPQLIPSNPSSPVRQRSTLDLNFGCTQRSSPIANDKAPISLAAAAAMSVANAELSDSDDEDEEHDVHEVDLSADSPVYSDAGSSSSSSSSSLAVAYWPVTNADLQSGTATQQKPKVRNKSLSDDLPDWLQDQPSPFSPSASTAPATAPVVDFSHTAQQLEQDIRQALDSAATRVTRENERRELFQQELSKAASYPVSLDEMSGHQRLGGYDGIQPPPAPTMLSRQAVALAPPAPAELLLLMEVVIGEGRSETIEVHVGDKPQALASQFADKHALKSDAIPKLMQLIQDQLDALNLEELGFFDEAPSDTGATAASGDVGTEMTEQHQQQHQIQEYEEYRPELSLQLPPAPTTVPRRQQDQRDEPQAASSYHQHDYHRRQDPPSYPPTARDSDDNGYHIPEPDTTGYNKQEREHSRAMNYQNLMAKYGHYSQHSDKVNPGIASTAATTVEHRSNGGGRHTTVTASSKAKDPLTFRNIQLAEHTHRVAGTERRHTLSVHKKHHHSASNKHKEISKPPPVFDRLHALAESKDKWIRRAQNAKQRELEREQDQRKVEMAAKSRDLIAHRATGGYAHIGERLYEEALSDMAKRDRVREQRAAEREHQIDWMCPKCAFMNQHSDDVCHNIVAAMSTLPPGAGAASSFSNDDLRARARRDSVNSACFMDTPEAICGQQKPEQLFRPTLLASSSSVAHAITMNKERAARVASIRRQKNQQAIEDEFRQTCPFRPKINEVSEEIVRERLESEATRDSSSATTTTTVNGELRRKDPHLALYEDSFHVRANKQAREEEHLRQYSFKPDIGVNALWINGDKTKEDFVERLAVSKYQEFEKKRQALHDKYAFDRDPSSGREYFKPEIGRAPVFNRNERGLPIGEFLHESHREQQEYHRRLLQQSMQELHQKRHQGFVSETSRQALAMRKKKTFSRIFDALMRVSILKSDGPCPQARDTDLTVLDATGTLDQSPTAMKKPEDQTAVVETAVVTPSLVQLKLLPREIAQVVPVIFEFANHEPFTREQFGSYMDKLMTEVPGLTYTQVLFLTENLNDGKSSRASLSEKHSSNNHDEAEAEELTFHPVIDKNSSVIAKKHGRADRSKVFQALNQYFEHYKDRKTQIRKQQQREFERAHPFQPTLVTKNRKQTSATFYDKIKRMEQQQAAIAATATTGLSSSGGHPAGQQGDIPPLHTAIANARPCVRPIENDARELMVALETHLSSCSSSLNYLEDNGQQNGSDEDADLTSRVLAALDELPSSSSTASSSLSQSQSSAVTALSNADASRNAKLLLAQEDSDRVLLRTPESTRVTAAAPSYSF